MRYILLLGVLFVIGCKTSVQSPSTSQSPVEDVETKHVYEVQKSNEEWKKELSEMEYYVLREAGTERAFTGDLLSNKEVGVYTCAGCGQKLFSSENKFKSGTGWPSFYDVYHADSIDEDTDYNIGYARTELLCSRCGGHLGHVFEDGPPPTGLRYCINSAALDFEKE